MKRNTGFFALIFSLLLIIVSNHTAYAQAGSDDETAISPKQELNYEEMNALIDKVVFQKFIGVIQFFKKYLTILLYFFMTRPPLVRSIIIITFLPACFGIISSHVIGIYQNKNRWERHPYYDLMYSYFIRTGTLQRKESYSDAHSLLRDHKWSWVSFAGLAHRLGNYTDKSIMLMFAMSFGYIPLFILGIIEMFFRIVLGTIWLLAFNLLHSLLLLITKLISFALIPAANIIDKIIRKTQYCPYCYETFYLPEFICPSCGKVHKRLIPGNCGVLFARCACNKAFIPCVSFTGRSFLASRCPSCSGELYAANPKHFSIAVIGGNNSGKTAFIAAFSNLYKSVIRHKPILTIEGKPDNYFSELHDVYHLGKAAADNESRTYSIIHQYWKMKTDSLVLYDTLAKHVISDSYPRSPKYFRFCNGIILILDPLSVQHIQKELKDENSIDTSGSSDDTNQMVVQFIHQYNTICGFSTGIMSGIPVAVLINKVDIEIVKREIGRDAIKALYDENPSAYNNNEDNARDQICRTYLTKIGLINVLNNIEAIFANVSFFPVSAAGHAPKEGSAFTPIGVMEPAAWIAKKGRSRIAGLLSSGVKIY
jgi:hypothetical protein